MYELPILILLFPMLLIFSTIMCYVTNSCYLLFHLLPIAMVESWKNNLTGGHKEVQIHTILEGIKYSVCT